MYGGTATCAERMLTRPQVKFMPMAPARRRKVEPISGAVGVVEDNDLKHVVHVVRRGRRPCTLGHALSWRRRAALAMPLADFLGAVTGLFCRGCDHHADGCAGRGSPQTTLACNRHVLRESAARVLADLLCDLRCIAGHVNRYRLQHTVSWLCSVCIRLPSCCVGWTSLDHVSLTSPKSW